MQPRSLPLLPALLLTLATPALQAGNPCDGNHFDQVTLQPGCSAFCYEQPCEVQFRMPKGKGQYRVTGHGLDYGSYPAGRTVSFGPFWRGSYIFNVVGSGAPPAYLHVGDNNRNN